MRELDRQDHKEQKGVGAQILLNPHHHPYQGASWGTGLSPADPLDLFHGRHRPTWLESHSGLPGPAKAFTGRCRECTTGVMPTHM